MSDTNVAPQPGDDDASDQERRFEDYATSYVRHMGPPPNDVLSRLQSLLNSNLESLNTDTTTAIAELLDRIFAASTIQLQRTDAVRDILRPAQRYEPILLELRALTTATNYAMQLLVVSAVRVNAMTRRHAAELLNVHENTVARWVKDEFSFNRKFIDLMHRVHADQIIRLNPDVRRSEITLTLRNMLADMPQLRAVGRGEPIRFRASKKIDERLTELLEELIEDDAKSDD